MSQQAFEKLWKMIGLRYKSHPWHGISIGEQAPEKVNAFIEVIPSDTIKYEVDKETGYLMIDRPQKFSNIVPALYGFIPQTYCKDKTAEICREATGRKQIVGDDDPLDICILTEREITHGNIIVKAKPVGGFRMIDGGEADDKIIAIMDKDEVYSHWKDIKDFPKALVDRLKHYFLTYKQLPGEEQKCEITHTYDRKEAMKIIEAAREDYQDAYGDLEDIMSMTLFEAFNFSQRTNNILDRL